MRNLTVNFTVDKCTHEKLNGEHTETFDLSKLTEADIEQYVAQTLIIRRQGMLRSKGADKIVVGTWNVPAPGKRIEVTEEGVKKAMAKAAGYVNLLTEAEKVKIAESMGFTYVPKGLAANDPELEAGESDEEKEA